MRTLPFAFAVLVVVGLAGCERPPEKKASERPIAPLHHVLAVDGDALVIDGRHVRLANAATPQRMPRARCWAEAIAGREARRKVTELATRAEEVQIQTTGGKDEYGREYARVSLDGLDLGQALLDDAVAVAPGPRPFDWCAPVSTGMDGGPNVAVLSDLGR